MNPSARRLLKTRQPRFDGGSGDLEITDELIVSESESR